MINNTLHANRIDMTDFDESMIMSRKIIMTLSELVASEYANIFYPAMLLATAAMGLSLKLEHKLQVDGLSKMINFLVITNAK